MRLVPGVLGAVVALTLLAGCANPVDHLLEQSGVDVDIRGDGITVGTGDGGVQIGGSVQLPADLPAGVPVPRGDLTAALSASRTWTLTYGGVDRAAIDALVAELGAAGFEEVQSLDQGGGMQAGYQDAAWTVGVVWGGADDAGGTLVYAITGR